MQLQCIQSQQLRFASHKRLEVHGGVAQFIGRARVAELADAPDLGSGSERIRGSSPLARTNLDLQLKSLRDVVAIDRIMPKSAEKRRIAGF
jgi:hypothetical protein